MLFSFAISIPYLYGMKRSKEHTTQLSDCKILKTTRKGYLPFRGSKKKKRKKLEDWHRFFLLNLYEWLRGKESGVAKRVWDTSRVLFFLQPGCISADTPRMNSTIFCWY